jgi:hypothetical protein
MYSIRDWARKYREMGLAICSIAPGEKRPTYAGWNLRSIEPDEFQPGDNIGILTGKLSGNLICVDLELLGAGAAELADRCLPHTRMVEGCPGNPKTHRWYRVKNIPKQCIAKLKVSKGLRGPRTRHFLGPEGKVMLEFRGTGSQAAAPPSLWPINGKEEVREWHCLEEPTVIDCWELFLAVTGLATARGWSRERCGWGRQVFGPLPGRKARTPDLSFLPIAERTGHALQTVELLTGT